MCMTRLVPMVTAAAMLSLLCGCGETPDPGTAGDAGGTPDTKNDAASELVAVLELFNAGAAEFAQMHHDFVAAAQKWEAAQLDSNNNADSLALVEAYITAGVDWLAAATVLNALADEVARVRPALPNKSAAQGIAVPGGPVGPSPMYVKQVGALLDQTQQQIEQAKQKYPNAGDGAHPDAEALADELTRIRQENSLTAARLGVATYAGIGGGVVTGATTYVLITTGAVVVSAPVAVVVGGMALLGGGVSSAIAWWWTAPSSNCSADSQKVLTGSGAGVCSFVAGSIGPGEAIPGVIPQSGGTLVLSIPGYMPFSIENFQLPPDGQKLTIDFTPVPLAEDTLDDVVVINLNTALATGATAADVLSVTAAPSPVDPTAYEDVTVTVTIIPAIPGVVVSYVVTGTDGYSASGSPTTDANGRFTFSIPGGAEGVRDTIDLAVGLHTHTVTYTF